MRTDFDEKALYREAESIYKAFRRPGTGQISDATEVHASPDGQQVAFVGTLVDGLEGLPPTRICQVQLDSGDTRVVTFGPNIDRSPKYAPDGQHIAFLSDREKLGDFQLYLLDVNSGVSRATQRVAGWVEYLHWSPDGSRILLGVAAHGADIAGGQGAVASEKVSDPVPSWVPEVDAGEESYRWRRVWVYEVSTDRVCQVSHGDYNIWEAVWYGNEALAAVASVGPGEGSWYNAGLHIIETEATSNREIYTPQDQIGWPSASPSGRHLAIVEAVCSDRWIVAGDLRVIEADSGAIRRVDAGGVDITYTEWRSDQQLLLAGHRGFETVVGIYDAVLDEFTEKWSSCEVTTGGRYIAVSGINKTGDCALVGENFLRAPEIAVIRNGVYQAVKSFDLAHDERVRDGRVVVERVSWEAPDGLEIQGWVLRPNGEGPHPLVMEIHGGPVWHWRPKWLGRSNLHSFMLVQNGYAVFFPNPRGSAGRGQEFIRYVLGDMGGNDTYDYLSGVDYLVRQGIADPSRLGVTGVSYGGFMTSWLTTQDPRFSAAVSISPVTNWSTQHLLSNIPQFVELFLADTYTNPTGKYFQRSPVMHAHKAKTPTLNICGALDRCTPSGEAAQYHNALLENKVNSVLVTYPEEGHGIRKLPASIDCAARVVAWFQLHMPAVR